MLSGRGPTGTLTGVPGVPPLASVCTCAFAPTLGPTTATVATRDAMTSARMDHVRVFMALGWHCPPVPGAHRCTELSTTTGSWGARRRHRLEHRPAARRGARRPYPDPLRLPGTPARRDRPVRLDGRRVGLPGQAPPAPPVRSRLRTTHDPPFTLANGGFVAHVPARCPVDRGPGPPDPGRLAHQRLHRGRVPPARPRTGTDRRGAHARRAPRSRPARSRLGPGRGGTPAHATARPPDR